MAQEVYKNNQGQVLFGNSGNVFKVPYNFGNSFIFKGSYVYLLGHELNIDNSLYSLIVTSRHSYYRQKSFLSILSENYIYSVESITDDNVFATTPPEGYVTIGAPFSNDDTMSIYINNNGEYKTAIGRSGKFDKISTRKDISSIYVAENINSINIGVGGASRTDPTNLSISNNTSANVLFKNVLLFTREISSEEGRFLYNNGNFSEPLSSDSLLIYLKLDRAEIVNNGSGDFVGVRNFGSGPHAHISGLPAGTLQEQLDWANANLFVPFI